MAVANSSIGRAVAAVVVATVFLVSVGVTARQVADVPVVRLEGGVGRQTTQPRSLPVTRLDDGSRTGDLDATTAVSRTIASPLAVREVLLLDKAANRVERAKESHLQALVVDPRSAPAHFNLAALYEQSGDTVQAVQHYRAFLEHAGVEYAPRAVDARARIDALNRAR